MSKERRMDFIGIAGITILVFVGMYCSLSAKDIFTGAGFLFGIVYFFLYKAVTGKSFEEMHFSVRSLGNWLKRPGIWGWVFLPAAVNLLQTAAARLISPSFYGETVRDELTRISVLVPTGATANFPVLIPYLLILAMGEEICFRAFFQDRLSQYIPVGLSILVSSAVFTAGHVSSEPLGVAVFWVLNTFVLSVLFGIIQKKTGNAYVPTISHFVSNYLAFVLIYFLR